MTSRSVILLLMPLTLLAGCAVHPAPGLAAVAVRVVAEPKAGAAVRFTHVPVYDAALTATDVSDQFEHVHYSDLPDIVVWLRSATPDATEPPHSHLLHINPHHALQGIQPVSVGQQLVFLNTSSRPISLYSVSDGNDFDLPPIAPGATAHQQVRTAGLIEILADPSQPPVATLYAAPSSSVTRARSGQTVVFNNLWPGTYQAVSWHPRLPGASSEVTLAANQVTHCTLSVSVNSLPTVQPR